MYDIMIGLQVLIKCFIIYRQQYLIMQYKKRK